MAEQLDPNSQMVAASLIENQAFGEKRNPFDLKNNHYDFNENFREWKPGDDPRSIHRFSDLVRCLESEKNVTIEAKVFAVKHGEAHRFRLGKKAFLETVTGNKKRTFREGIDSFRQDSEGALGSRIGDDFTPLMGGPFSKQLYYTDYIKMHNAAFFAFHHDPVARRAINMMKQFTLGRGFKVSCDDPKALALWEAFAEANDFYNMFSPLAIELATYGELMIHWLPDNATKYTWQIPDSEIPRGLIPRIRLTDPSTIWEIITYPEDITRVIGYQQIFPTQWQMYTNGQVPGTKFIYQMIPAPDMQHFKFNAVSNEKRGRSDLFPILSYLKRLRDAVDYNLVAEMKNAAWAIDTTVEGSKTDIDQYVASQRKLGTIPGAGSEFVHSKKITREYRSNGATGGRESPIFEWCLSMIAMGLGIPISYLGAHLSGGQTRASAVVGTEPVAKLFEDRQNDYDRVIQAVSQKLFKKFGMRARLEVTYPEIITQDRSAKLQDLALAQSEGWINKKNAATSAAKELGFDEYNYDSDSDDEEQDTSDDSNGLTPLASPDDVEKKPSNGGLSGDERKSVKDANS